MVGPGAFCWDGCARPGGASAQFSPKGLVSSLEDLGTSTPNTGSMSLGSSAFLPARPRVGSVAGGLAERALLSCQRPVHREETSRQ